MRILLVEDDSDLQRLLKKALVDAGYVVDAAGDGEEGHFLGDTEPYDAVILDLGLPKMDGVRVLEKWRHDGRKMPVLILTARDRWSDKVAGFDAGADDYLAKPFHTEELLARVRALLRRAAGLATSEIDVGPLKIDTRASRVIVDGNPVKLTSLEYRLLSYLAHHKGKVVNLMDALRRSVETGGKTAEPQHETEDVSRGKSHRKPALKLVKGGKKAAARESKPHKTAAKRKSA